MPVTVYFIKGRNYKNNKTKLITNFQSIKHFLLQRNFNYIVRTLLFLLGGVEPSPESTTKGMMENLPRQWAGR